jgi:hypothetical protein
MVISQQVMANVGTKKYDDAIAQFNKALAVNFDNANTKINAALPKQKRQKQQKPKMLSMQLL